MTDISTSRRVGPAAATRARRIAAVLLVVTAVLVGIGVASEDDGHIATGTEPGETDGIHDGVPGGTTEQDHSEEPTAAEPGDEEASHEPGEAASHEDGDEQALGIDVESPMAVTAAVAVSLVLAAGLWANRRREIAWAVVVVGLVFALFDAIEVAHQIDESRTGLAVIAALVAAGHLAASGAAGSAAASTPP